jgi:hypothetical protein
LFKLAKVSLADDKDVSTKDSARNDQAADRGEFRPRDGNFVQATKKNLEHFVLVVLLGELLRSYEIDNGLSAALLPGKSALIRRCHIQSDLLRQHLSSIVSCPQWMVEEKGNVISESEMSRRLCKRIVKSKF